METRRILVVDDDDGIRVLLCRMLRDQEYNVYSTESVAGAGAALAEQSFDAFLLDYRLRDGSGFDIAKIVRQQGSNGPIILITGYNSEVIAADVKKFEIFQIIEKPFTRNTICSALKTAFGQIKDAAS